jgi:hypothetical protein
MTSVGHLFTPRWDYDNPRGERAAMRINARDKAILDAWGRGPGLEHTFTDLLTGKKWRVRSAPCSLPDCYCAAVIIGEVKD